jgi:hypothetical protein
MTKLDGVLVKLIVWVCLQGCWFVEVESAENFCRGWFAIYHKVSLGVCRLFGLLSWHGVTKQGGTPSAHTCGRNKLGLVHSGMISCDLDTSENSLRSNLLQITVLPDLHYQVEKRHQVGDSGRFPAGDITASSCRYSSRVESATNIDVIYKIEVIKPVSNAKTSTAQ